MMLRFFFLKSKFSIKEVDSGFLKKSLFFLFFRKEVYAKIKTNQKGKII
jgi:hypothetical protein